MDKQDLIQILACQNELLALLKTYEDKGMPPALYCSLLIRVATHIAFKHSGTQAQAEHTLREYLKSSLHLERAQLWGTDE